MMIDNLELIYWSNDGGHDLPLEQWQYFAIQQILGLEIAETNNGLKISHFTKDEVMKRLKKIGILVDPKEVEIRES